MAKNNLPEVRYCEFAGPGERGKSNQQMAVRGCEPNQHLGMERRRILDLECDVPLSGRLPGRPLCSPGSEYPLLRHNLSGAIRWLTTGSSRRVDTKLAGNVRKESEGPANGGPRNR